MPSKKSTRKRPSKPEPVNHAAVVRAIERMPSRLYKCGETLMVKGTATEVQLFQEVQPAMITIQYPDPPLTMAWLCSLWVPWMWRKRGLGRALLTHAVEICHKAGFDAALAALPFGENAPHQCHLMKFYQSCGFEVLEGIMLVNRRPRA
jgi:GNAT superfamily N-acetyltransferase